MQYRSLRAIAGWTVDGPGATIKVAAKDFADDCVNR